MEEIALATASWKSLQSHYESAVFGNRDFPPKSALDRKTLA
jgi:hypothetical protein